MPIMINDSPRYAAAAASRALSLAVRAEALADEIDAWPRDIRAAREEPVRWAGFRCDTAIGWMRQASTEPQDTADHLDRIADALKPGANLPPRSLSRLTCPAGQLPSEFMAIGKNWCDTG